MSSNEIKITRTKKIAILLFSLLLLLVVLIVSAINTISSERNLPSLLTTKKELAIRGNILSSDNFKISTSKKLYKASIDTRSIDPNKKELFINLFSIYSNIPVKTVRKKLNEASRKKPGHLVLSYNIDSRTAKNLKELGFYLRKMSVFKAIKVRGGRFLYGLSIDESGEKREFTYKDTLTPAIGYMSKYESKHGTTKLKGIKGLEKSYDNLLNDSSDGILKGERDVLSYISFNKQSLIRSRVDGSDLILNIPLKLQKNVEMILDEWKEKIGCDEILVSVMDSKTGKILTLATSNRFDPDNIKQSDIPNLNVNAIEYQFEPGSVMKPIAISLVLDKNRIKPDELFFAYNKGKMNKKGEYPRGKYKIGRWWIHDDHQFKKHYLTLEDIVIYSSNIGTLFLAQRLKGAEFHKGLKKFGITQKTGIDLPYEKEGKMPKVYKFRAGEDKGKDNIYKATVSYGQGMTATFMQILKAYSAFNNDGKTVTPQIVSKVVYKNQTVELKDEQKNEQVVKKATADKMKKLLIKTVNTGTGKKAKYEGLEIGGKTGTANIARGGKYQRKYMSSFFGFANDKENRYTVGVTVNNPPSRGKYWYYYYASESAVPVFKEIVKILVKLNYLTPETNE